LAQVQLGLDSMLEQVVRLKVLREKKNKWQRRKEKRNKNYINTTRVALSKKK